MAQIQEHLNSFLSRQYNKTIKSRNTIGEKLKKLRDNGAPIMFGSESEDVKAVMEEFGFRLSPNSYTRTKKDYIPSLDMKPEDQAVFLQSIETLLSMDFISSISELRNLLIKLKVIGSAHEVQKIITMDINYTRIVKDDGSFDNPLDHFDPLQKAIRNKNILWIEYRDFKGETHSWSFQPVHIRESGDRWYLLGYDIDDLHVSKEPHVLTLGFERIIRFRVEPNRRWIDRLSFDPKEYFSDIIGVGKPWDSEAETIRIKVNKTTLPYWQTKRIHPSQDIGEPDKKGNSIISFHLIPNKEFFEILYGQSKNITIEEPIDLHQRYKDIR